MRGVDIEFKKDNEVVSWNALHVADELVIHIKVSKTDQLGFGTTRNHFVTGEELCPVIAMKEYYEALPGRKSEAERQLPLGRLSDGSVVTRELIQTLLRSSALADGQDPTRVGTHSLRIGGASSMWHTLKDAEYIQRFGRWNSPAYHRYMWESHEMQKGVARSMATDNSTLHMSREAGKPKRREVRFSVP